MNKAYTSLVAEWYAMLLDVTVAFTGVNDTVRERAFSRLHGLSVVARRYAGYGLLEAPEVVSVLPTHDDATAIGNVRSATARLKAFLSSSSWISQAELEAEYLGRRFHQSLCQRRNKLYGLLQQLEDEGWRAFYVQMNATVSPVYACDVMHESWQRRPVAQPEEALAVMTLNEANVPSDYAASLLPRAALNRENAKTVVRLYHEGIPAELGASLL
jgi:hypothetical protein